MQYHKHIAHVRNNYKTYLSSTLRYERFMEGESLDEWVALLGPDVLLLTHADETAAIAERFITFSKNNLKLSIKEQEQLLLAAWIHDWGEIIVDGEGVGDVTFENKTEADQAVETTIINKLIHDFQPEEIREAFHIAYQEVVIKRNPTLGEYFNVIERIGYLETAIAAYTGKNGKQIKNWKGLTGNVLSNQIIKLTSYSKSYDFVKDILQKNAHTISTMFSALIEIPVPIDNERNPSYDKTKLLAAYNVWGKIKH